MPSKKTPMQEREKKQKQREKLKMDESKMNILREKDKEAKKVSRKDPEKLDFERGRNKERMRLVRAAENEAITNKNGKEDSKKKMEEMCAQIKENGKVVDKDCR